LRDVKRGNDHAAGRTHAKRIDGHDGYPVAKTTTPTDQFVGARGAGSACLGGAPMILGPGKHRTEDDGHGFAE